jgi:catechol 2,3-dioxygenase-like lactoylglutathione lyase family enzyme
MSHSIRTIVIPVRDRAAARALYGTALGAEPYANEPYYVDFRVGDQEIGLDPNGHNHGTGEHLAAYVGRANWRQEPLTPESPHQAAAHARGGAGQDGAQGGAVRP